MALNPAQIVYLIEEELGLLLSEGSYGLSETQIREIKLKFSQKFVSECEYETLSLYNYINRLRK